MKVGAMQLMHVCNGNSLHFYFVHSRLFVGDEDAMALHLSELLTSVATPCTQLLVYAARL